MKTKLFILVSTCLLIACSSPKETTSNTSQLPAYQANNPQVLFYNILLSKKTTPATISIENLIVSKGKLKEDYPKTAEYHAYQLLCSFLDKDKKVLKQTTLDNPLNRRFEYTNDGGQLESKVMEKQEGKISLRVQLTEGMYYLKLEEVVNQNELLDLGMIKL